MDGKDTDMAIGDTVDPETLALFVEGATDRAMFVLDPEGRIRSWNAGAEILFGYRPDAVIGERGDKLYSVQDRAAAKPESDMAKVRARGRLRENTWRVPGRLRILRRRRDHRDPQRQWDAARIRADDL